MSSTQSVATRMVAIVVRVFSVATRLVAFVGRVFSAFFGFQKDDGLAHKSVKSGGMILSRVVYAIADYWLMIASGLFIIFVDRTLGYGWFGLFMMMWGFDIIVASAFVIIWRRTGEDVTLGESYRRATDAIREESRVAGYLAFAGVLVKATFWDGPEHIVTFFHKELKTEWKMLVVLLGLTAIQSAIWTPIYILSFDSVSELWTYVMAHL